MDESPSSIEDFIRDAMDAGRDIDIDDWRRGLGGDVRGDVSAGFLANVLTRPPDRGRRPRAVVVRHARIEGQLDLRHDVVHHPLVFRSCTFTEEIDMTGATVPGIELHDCDLPGFRGRNLKVATDVELREIRCPGEIRLNGARVEGSVSCSGSIGDVTRRSFTAQGALIKGDLFLRSTPRTSLRLEGPVRLVGTRIEGQLSCTGASVDGGESGVAITADGLMVSGDVFFSASERGRFEARGEVRLIGAIIGGQLNCTGGLFQNPGEDALSMDGVSVAGDLLLRHSGEVPFEAKGEVRLPGARIGGLFDCSGGSFWNPGKIALRGDGITVGAATILRAHEEPFEAHGEVRLIGADLGRQLICSGARFENSPNDALVLDASSTDAVFLDSYESLVFEARGKVSLVHLKVGRLLTCRGALLENPNRIAVDAERLRVDGALIWQPSRVQGVVDFSFASAGVFADDPESWSEGTLNLNGFLYNSLMPMGRARDRLRWLACHGGYSPSSYEQLIATYRVAGYRSDAREVARAKQERERAELKGPERWWNWFLGRFVGHGYQPWRAGLLLALVVLIGWGVFATAFASETMQPIKTGSLPDPEPLIFSLDTALPLIHFQQEYWVPDPQRPWGDACRIWYWTSIGAGWILTTLFVGGVSGLLKRD